VIKVSAPGSLMLLGEHAVLSGCPALLVAHKGRILVSLELGGEGCWVHSDFHGSFDLRSSETPPAFSFVKEAFALYKTQMPASLQLKIFSDFSEQIGFGSSAAVTVATLGALWTYLNPEKDFDAVSRQFLWEKAKEVIQKVQGMGSGADAAASLWGGVVLHNPITGSTQQIRADLPLVAVYSGIKRKTPEVVEVVRQRFQAFPHIWSSFLQTSKELVDLALPALLENNLERVGKIFDIAQGLMDAYGVNTPTLADLIFKLRTQPTIWGAKISGSGLGDCVIGLGHLNHQTEKLFHTFPLFSIETTAKGLMRETL
jgi:mevalonate kinase